MTEEIVPLEDPTGVGTTRDDLHLRPRHEVEEAARKWYDIAYDMRGVQDQLVEDLETALNICKHYQGMFALLDGVNDPNLITVRRLLEKYKMGHTPPKNPARIFVDGMEITSYPDSVDGKISEVIKLTSEEYYGTQTIELIQSEDGEFHVIPKGEEVAPETGECIAWVTDVGVRDSWLDRIKQIAQGLAHWHE